MATDARTDYVQRTCHGKKQYETFYQADHARKELKRLGDVRTPLSTYMCKICHKFHFGHQPDVLTAERRKHKRERVEWN